MRFKHTTRPPTAAPVHFKRTDVGQFVNPRALDARGRADFERHGFDPEQALEFLDIVAPIFRGHGRQTPDQFSGKRGWTNLQGDDWDRKRYFGPGLLLAHFVGGKFAVAACSADYSKLVSVDIDAGADLEDRYKSVRETLGDPSALIASPSGGLHLHYVSTVHRWTATIYPLLLSKLQAAGIEVAPGRVEIFPRPTKPGARRALLRLPFVGFRWVCDSGADLATGRMLDLDTLEPVHRAAAEGVALFVGARREDWAVMWKLENYNGSSQHAPRVPAPRSPAKRSPAPRGYGDLSQWQRLRDSTTPADAELTREQYTGEDFARVAAALEAHGLQAAGQRHAACRMLGFGFCMRGLADTAQDAGDLAVAWLHTKHNAVSATYNRSPAAAVADARAAAIWGAESFFSKSKQPPPAPRRSSRPQARQRHELTTGDHRYLARLVDAAAPLSARKGWHPRQRWRATVAMTSLLEHVGADGRRRLPLSKAELLELPGWTGGSRGTYESNVSLAAALGLWTLDAEGVQSPMWAARRPRRWRILWTFRGRRSYQARLQSHVPRYIRILTRAVLTKRGNPATRNGTYGRRPSSGSLMQPT